MRFIPIYSNLFHLFPFITFIPIYYIYSHLLHLFHLFTKSQKCVTPRIPDKQYKKALEIGCSIGVLTRMLALKCDELLSIDISNRALETAKCRLKDQPHVHFEQAAVPDGFPGGNYDLIVMSEVGYYLSMQDLSKTIQRIEEQLNTDGILILVHWTHFVEDYPLTGDQVHECFRTAELQHLHGHRTPDYRLDVYAKKYAL